MNLEMSSILGIGSLLVAIISYFLKKTNDKLEATATAVNNMEVKVTTIEGKISSIMASMESRFAHSMDGLEAKLVETFQRICHERQESCGKVQDLRIESLRRETHAFCQKLHAVSEDRAKKWERQETLNDNFRTHLARDASDKSGR
jgi:hypothetical protein